VPAVAIAGYTNAGKSTLLNALTGAGVLVDDSLFATLDPAVRRARTPSGRAFTLSDTVGFVRHLPHQLVEAFRSTLDEVARADLILHVVDGSDADPAAQLAAVREVLADIGAADVPEVVVINKADAADPLVVKGLCLAERDAVVVSARTGGGLDGLMSLIEQRLPGAVEEVSALVPYERGDLVARAHREGEVVALRHDYQGVRITARVPPGLAAALVGAAAPGTP
jgi:GTP-binding protein HflX